MLKNKLTKTIALIVFVVFLGNFKISQVNATIGCYYEGTDGAASVEIPDSYSTPYTKKIDNYTNNTDSMLTNYIANWYLSDIESLWYDKNPYNPVVTNKVPYTDYSSYNGYDDVYNGNRCPSKLILVLDTFTRSHIYFSDDANVNKVLEYAKEDSKHRVTHGYGVSQSSILNLTSSSGFAEPAPDTGVQQITPRSCTCSATGTLAGSTVPIHADYEITTSLGNPNVKILIGTSSTSGSIQNWQNKSLTPSTSYTGISDISKTNNCPTNMIVAKKKKVFLSDSANVSTIISDVKSLKRVKDEEIYSLTCTEDTSTPPSAAQRPTQKPQYDNPEVRTDVVTPLPVESGTLSCGNYYVSDIPTSIPRVTRILYLLIQIIVPIALVILGMLDLMKAISAQKDDEIKKGQQTFIKRLIAAAIVFFAFAIVKVAVGLFADSSSEIVDCMNCFLRGSDYCD